MEDTYNEVLKAIRDEKHFSLLGTDVKSSQCTRTEGMMMVLKKEAIN